MAKIKILVSYIEDFKCGFWAIKMAPWGSQAKLFGRRISEVIPSCVPHYAMLMGGRGVNRPLIYLTDD